ncbi:MAG: hypothetical protein AB7O21_06750 [Gammaproteobacteria bacterium]
MPKNLSQVLAAAVLFAVAASPRADGSAHPGVERAQDGAVQTIRAPLKVVEGVQQDTAAHGPVGVVTGSVKGGARAAAQAVTGALDVGVGAVEALTAPLTQKR